MENEPKEQENQEELTQEEPALEAGYDVKKWAELKADRNTGTYRVLVQGVEMGMPRAEIDSFISAVVEQEEKNTEFRYSITRSMSRTFPGWSSDEDIRALGEQAYQEAIAAGDSKTAISVAKDLYGADSVEYQDALKVRTKEKEEELQKDEKMREVRISENATVADLLTKIEKAEEKGDRVPLEEELHDNFDNDVVDNFIDLFDSPEAASIKILDFFTQHGYSKADIEIYLPIKFV